MSDLDIMHIMRHSDVEVTRSSYIKVPDEAKATAMAKLQAVLGTPDEPKQRLGSRRQFRYNHGYRATVAESRETLQPAWILAKSY